MEVGTIEADCAQMADMFSRIPNLTNLYFHLGRNAREYAANAPLCRLPFLEELTNYRDNLPPFAAPRLKRYVGSISVCILRSLKASYASLESVEWEHCDSHASKLSINRCFVDAHWPKLIRLRCQMQ